MSAELEITLASDVQRDDIFVEISLIGDGHLVAEVSKLEGPRQIEIFSRSDGESWKFKLDELIEILQMAKVR